MLHLGLCHLVPLISDILFPVLILFDLVDSVLDDSEGLSDLVVLHVLFIVKVVGKLNKVIDFGLFLVFLLLWGHGPCWLLRFLGLAGLRV